MEKNVNRYRLLIAAFLLAAVAWSSSAFAACTTSGTNLCIQNSRMRVNVNWTNPYVNPPTNGVGTPVQLTSDTGYFWFFNSSNVELVVKILDATSVNGHFWLLSGALSDVTYTINILDTNTQATKSYTLTSQPGSPVSFKDLNLF